MNLQAYESFLLHDSYYQELENLFEFFPYSDIYFVDNTFSHSIILT